jgi:pimeloyl-ACP methyl ester carboxylesterase
LKRWLKRGLLLLLAGFGVFIFGFAPYYLAGLATTRRFQFPDRDNAGLTPASFELPFEEVAFNAADGVPLKGWWVPAQGAKGTVVLVHGLNRSRLEMVRKVPFLNRSGWNAVLFDLRHHGASGGGVSSFGFFEKEDAKAAAALARSRAPGPVVAWGVSLGGATSVLASAEDPTIAGVVCDSSYRSLRDTVSHHVTLARRWRWWIGLLPQWPVADEVVFWMGRRGGFPPEAVDVEAAAARLSGRPCLFVCNTRDRRMPKEIAYELKAVVGESARVLEVNGDSHGGAYRDGTAAYEAAVAQVLDASLAASPAQMASAGGAGARSRP